MQFSPQAAGPTCTLLSWVGFEGGPRFIVEVALDVAVESTIVFIVSESGLGQSFPGAASSDRDRAEVRSSRSRARAGRAKAKALCPPLGLFDCFSFYKSNQRFFKNYEKKQQFSQSYSHWYIGFHNSTIHK